MEEKRYCYECGEPLKEGKLCTEHGFCEEHFQQALGGYETTAEKDRICGMVEDNPGYEHDLEIVEDLDQFLRDSGRTLHIVGGKFYLNSWCEPLHDDLIDQLKESARDRAL